MAELGGRRASALLPSPVSLPALGGGGLLAQPGSGWGGGAAADAHEDAHFLREAGTGAGSPVGVIFLSPCLPSWGPSGLSSLRLPALPSVVPASQRSFCGQETRAATRGKRRPSF